MSVVDWKCHTCGDTALVVQSIAGAPWRVMCGTGHPFERFGMDVVIELRPST